MINELTKIYEDANLSGAVSDILFLPVFVEGDEMLVRSIDLQVKENVAGEDAVFSLKQNGAVVSGIDLTISVGQKSVSVPNLNIDVEKGDAFVLSLVSGAVSSPVALTLNVDDGVSVPDLSTVVGESGELLSNGGQVIVHNSDENTTAVGTDETSQLEFKADQLKFNAGSSTEFYINDILNALVGSDGIAFGAATDVGLKRTAIGRARITDGGSGLGSLEISGLMPKVVSKNADYTLTTLDFAVGADSSGAARTMTLPASPVDGQIAWIFDQTGNAGANNITVARNGKTIQGAAADKKITGAFGFIVLQYRAAANDWNVIASAGLDSVVVLTDGATINADASKGDFFSVTLGGNRTLAAPTNLTPGKVYVFEFIQDATGSRTITLNSIFAFGTDITAVTLTTTANKRDYLTCVYRNSKLYVTGFVKGY